MCGCKRINILPWKEKYGKNNICECVSFLLRKYILNERTKQEKIKKKENLNEIELWIPLYLLEKPHWKAYAPLADRWKFLSLPNWVPLS